tara:strand:+ start:6172 stop:6681 length:510 start_codon:yes stop_codon:yes gene_type:complete
MNTLDNLEQYLSEWIDKIDVKNDKPFINGRSIQYCPYAKAAWKNNKTKIVKIKELTLDNFWGTVTKELNLFGKEKDIVIIGATTDVHVINGMQLVGGCDAINCMLAEQKQDKWLLNQYGEDYTMVMIQRMTDLDNASITLEKKGYYEGLNEYSFNKQILLRRKMREKLK